MKNRLLVGLILVLLVAGFLVFRRHPGGVTRPETGVTDQSAAGEMASALARQDSNTVGTIAANFARVQPAPEPVDAAVNLTRAPAGPPSPLQFTNFAPATVLETVRHAMRQYGDLFGGNPVGNNAEITAALAGNNPKHLNFIQAEAGLRINENGELVDPWGTPYFFHQLSAHDMEIHSAGPDLKMWTYDDLVQR